MKSIDQILKLSKNPHYHLKKAERDSLDAIAQTQFGEDFDKMNDEQLQMLFREYNCDCGGKK